MIDWRTIDWKTPGAKISKHFTVHEAIYLHRWSRLADERDGLNDHVKECIVRFAAKADLVRDFLGLQMRVHRWFSPKGYNAIVGGAKGSKHMSLGDHSAMDFDCLIEGAESQGDACDIIRASLEPKLEEMVIRLEKNPGASWVHIDDGEVVFFRYFRP